MVINNSLGSIIVGDKKWASWLSFIEKSTELSEIEDSK